MKTLDRRIRRTRRLLGEALISLALESSYDEISIRSLTQRADVGYATFYRHFKSKDELLMYVFRSNKEVLQNSMAKADSLRAEAEVVFQHFRRYPQEFRLYISLPDSNIPVQKIRAEFRDMLLARYKPKDGANVPPEVALNHILMSAVALLSWYLDNLDAYTPQEVTAMYADLISRETTAVSLERRSEWPPQSTAGSPQCDSDG